MNKRTLSPHEKSCLRWISRGRTVDEVALLEGKTVSEIERCLERAMALFAVGSIEEAIEKADLSGI